MAIRERTFYAAVCDACGREYEGSEYPYHASDCAALDEVGYADGLVIDYSSPDPTVICPSCLEAYTDSLARCEVALVLDDRWWLRWQDRRAIHPGQVALARLSLKGWARRRLASLVPTAPEGGDDE